MGWQLFSEYFHPGFQRKYPGYHPEKYRVPGLAIPPGRFLRNTNNLRHLPVMASSSSFRSVKIKVVNYSSCVTVFVYNRECGTACCFFDISCSAQCSDKTRFTYSHVTLKSIYFFTGEGFPENTRCFVNLRQVIMSIPFNKDSSRSVLHLEYRSGLNW